MKACYRSNLCFVVAGLLLVARGRYALAAPEPTTVTRNSANSVIKGGVAQAQAMSPQPAHNAAPGPEPRRLSTAHKNDVQRQLGALLKKNRAAASKERRQLKWGLNSGGGGGGGSHHGHHSHHRHHRHHGHHRHHRHHPHNHHKHQIKAPHLHVPPPPPPHRHTPPPPRPPHLHVPPPPPPPPPATTVGQVVNTVNQAATNAGNAVNAATNQAATNTGNAVNAAASQVGNGLNTAANTLNGLSAAAKAAIANAANALMNQYKTMMAAPDGYLVPKEGTPYTPPPQELVLKAANACNIGAEVLLLGAQNNTKNTQDDSVALCAALFKADHDTPLKTSMSSSRRQMRRQGNRSNSTRRPTISTKRPTLDKYKLGQKGSDSCPVGAIGRVPQAECVAAGAAELPAGKAHGRTIQVGSWGPVPPGCSLQSGGDWAVHFNTNAGGKNDGSYTPVCATGTSTNCTSEAGKCTSAACSCPSTQIKKTLTLAGAGGTCWACAKPGGSICTKHYGAKRCSGVSDLQALMKYCVEPCMRTVKKGKCCYIPAKYKNLPFPCCKSHKCTCNKGTNTGRRRQQAGIAITISVEENTGMVPKEFDQILKCMSKGMEWHKGKQC